MTIKKLQQQQKALNDRYADLGAKRTELWNRAKAIRATVADAAAGVEAAQANLSAALLAEARGERDGGINEAKAKLSEATTLNGASQVAEAEANALDQAAASLEAEMAGLAEQLQPLIRDERVLNVARLDQEAADEATAYAQALTALAAAAAKMAALSSLAERNGASPARYIAGSGMYPITTRPVGIDHHERPLLAANPSAMVPGATGDIAEKLRAEGFRV